MATRGEQRLLYPVFAPGGAAASLDPHPYTLTIGETMPQDWTDNLTALDLDNLSSVFGDVVRKDGRIAMDEEVAFRSCSKHTSMDATRTKRAKDCLQRLPDPGESIHIIMAGNFRNSDFVDAVLQMTAPVVAEELWLATLGLDRHTANLLFRLLDGGKIGRCHLLACVYFESHDKELWGWIVSELEKRGSRALAARNHCKLQLFGLDDGRRLVMETSANLRSCHMAEQACLTHDAGLYDFHRGWMDTLFAKASQ